MFKKMIQKSDELCLLKKDFKKKFNEKLSKMGLYSRSRIKIYSKYLDLEMVGKLSDIQIETLEKEFGIKLTRHECKRVLNYGEPLEFFVSEGEKMEFHLYRFR